MPFPTMITELSIRAGCKLAVGERLIPGTPGAITFGSIKKSKTLSKTPSKGRTSTSTPTPQPSQTPSVQPSTSQPVVPLSEPLSEPLLPLIHARQEVIIQEQQVIKKKQSKIMKILRWLVCREEERSGAHFVDSDPEDPPTGAGHPGVV